MRHGQQGQLGEVMEGLKCQVEGLVFISWLLLPLFILPLRVSSKLQLAVLFSGIYCDRGSRLWALVGQSG